MAFGVSPHDALGSLRSSGCNAFGEISASFRPKPTSLPNQITPIKVVPVTAHFTAKFAAVLSLTVAVMGSELGTMNETTFP